MLPKYAGEFALFQCCDNWRAIAIHATCVQRWSRNRDACANARKSVPQKLPQGGVSQEKIMLQDYEMRGLLRMYWRMCAEKQTAQGKKMQRQMLQEEGGQIYESTHVPQEQMWSLP